MVAGVQANLGTAGTVRTIHQLLGLSSDPRPRFLILRAVSVGSGKIYLGGSNVSSSVHGLALDTANPQVAITGLTSFKSLFVVSDNANSVLGILAIW